MDAKKPSIFTLEGLKLKKREQKEGTSRSSHNQRPDVQLNVARYYTHIAVNSWSTAQPSIA